jgi:hypothetical protein
MVDPKNQSTLIGFDCKITQKAIDKLVNSSECMDSIRNTKCYDYEARFGAFIRVKCGIILLSAIDWDKVAQAMEAAI